MDNLNSSVDTLSITPSTSSTPPKPNIVVLGSGVLGLSIALDLHAAGYHPLIIARDLPTDVHSSGFASPWAGCNWYSFAQNDDYSNQAYDKATYKRLGKFAEEQPDLCERIKFYDVWNEEVAEEPWFKDLVPDYALISGDDVPGAYTSGLTFKSFILHAPQYILHLYHKLLSLGVPVVRARLSSLDEAYNFELPKDVAESLGLREGESVEVDVVVNATGLGAKSLLGVEDSTVYPIRGQTVLIKSDYIGSSRRCYMGTRNLSPTDTSTGAKREPAYIIPRPGPSNTLILGGTYGVGDYNTQPDVKIAERIMKDCFALWPDIAGPPSETRSWRDIEVVSHNVGLRPARKDGVRVELEERLIRKAGGDSVEEALLPGPKIKSKRVNGHVNGNGDGEEKKKAVVHAYGIGPAGFQASLGIAEKVVELVKGYKKA